MNLTLPAVSQTPGPQWASEINGDLTLLDAHDHTTGKGLPVPVAGLSIDDDLGFGGVHGIEQASFLGLYPQAVSPVGGTRLYANTSGNLFYNNGSGTPVQITNGASVSPGTSGSISGLSFPAAAKYDNGTSTFSFYGNEGASQLAPMEHGPLLLHTSVAGSQALQIQPSASMVSGYTLTLPPTLPASVTSFLATSTTGVQSNVAPDNSTIEISSNIVQIKAFGVDTTQLADLSVETVKLADGAVSPAKMGSARYDIGNTGTGAASFSSLPSSPDTIITELSVSLTIDTYRPIIAFCMSDQSTAANSYFKAASHDAQVMIRITPPSGPAVNASRVLLKKDVYYPASSVQCMFEPTMLGPHSVTVYVSSPGVSADLDVYYMKFAAYQI
jgi:hypothetical protein